MLVPDELLYIFFALSNAPVVIPPTYVQSDTCVGSTLSWHQRLLPFTGLWRKREIDVSYAEERHFDSQWERVHDRITTYTDEAQRIADLAQLPNRAGILDLACGTGKHLIEFAMHGHRCVGVDRLGWKIDKAIEQSTSLGVEIDFVCADLRTYLATERFDLVFCFYALSTMRTDEDVLAVFNTAKNALGTNSPFIFNVINKEANDDPRSPVHSSVRETGYLRDFSLNEISGLLSRAGFTVKEACFSEIAEIKNLDLHICATLSKERP
jgi:SAM-dependent methyltransferase